MAGNKNANKILQNPPHLSRRSNYYRLDRGTSNQTGNARNFLFTNMPEQILGPMQSPSLRVEKPDAETNN